MLDLRGAVPTLMGSILSALAASSIILCYFVLPPQKHFRHTLILNLAIADFINSLNNTSSGFYAILHGSINPGFGCKLNGWMGQISVQATDFAILFISIATVYTLRQVNYRPQSSGTTKFLLTLGIWFVPACTSFTGLVLDDYKPVRGNWCWLSVDNNVLRYALGHGWRLSIILVVFSLHAYLSIYLHLHFRRMRALDEMNIDTSTGSSAPQPGFSSSFHSDEPYEWNEFAVYHEMEDGYLHAEISIKDGYPKSIAGSNGTTTTVSTSILYPKSQQPSLLLAGPMMGYVPSRESLQSKNACSFRPIGERTSLLTRDPLAIIRTPRPTATPSNNRSPKPYFRRIIFKSCECQVQKMLMLNAYPIAYILLWLPGILNRFAEMLGHKYRWLAIAQSSTQFVGLANAMVFWYNERIWTLFLLWWKCRGVKKPDEEMMSREDVTTVRALPVNDTTSDKPPEGWI